MLEGRRGEPDLGHDALLADRLAPVVVRDHVGTGLMGRPRQVLRTLYPLHELGAIARRRPGLDQRLEPGGLVAADETGCRMPSDRSGAGIARIGDDPP